MVALIEGSKAPDFQLKTSRDKVQSLGQALARFPLVLITIFKVHCPVCQLTLPYIQRLHAGLEAAGARNLPDGASPLPGESPLLVVCQDSQDETREFIEQYGLTMPVLVDDNLDVTLAYGLTNVPSLFLVRADYTIESTIVGFDKSALVSAAGRLAGEDFALFTSEENTTLPAFRPG